jgi:ankyrin repeat protein
LRALQSSFSIARFWESYMPRFLALIAPFLSFSSTVHAQIPPSEAQVAQYQGLLADAAKGDSAAIKRALANSADPNIRDEDGRTPLMVAAYRKQYDAAFALLEGKADANALEKQQYDVVTIASVADDPQMLKLALDHGASAKNITSPYYGTALIAAAHLGHAGIVRMLIEANAPLDHVNNLGWTALIEAIVLGNGDGRYQDTVKALVAAGANLNLADRSGATPLALAKSRNYETIVRILEDAGAK